MKKVYLSDLGPEVSTSVYSFWRWKAKEDLTVDRVKDIVAYALDLGINAFDLSPAYGNGCIEDLFISALSQLGINRQDVVLFSKIGTRVYDSQGLPAFRPLNEKNIVQQVNQSLEKLKSDYIDVLLLQEFDPLMSVDEVASALTSLQLRDKLKHVGVADFTTEEHKLLADRLPNGIVTNHFDFNVLNTTALKDGRIVVAKELYSKPMAFAPLADGRILNGTDEKAVAVRALLESLTSKYNSNIEQLAVSWIHRLGALPIIGSLSKERIKNAATADSVELDYADWHNIYDAVKQLP